MCPTVTDDIMISRGFEDWEVKKKKCYSASTHWHFFTTSQQELQFTFHFQCLCCWITSELSLRFFCTPGAIKTLHPAKCCPVFAPISEGVGGSRLGAVVSAPEGKQSGWDVTHVPDPIKAIHVHGPRSVKTNVDKYPGEGGCSLHCTLGVASH